MDLNLRQVRAFLAVARSGSFTRAATLLHLSQPALTVQIRNLEEALQCRLFDRNSRSVDITPLGRELLPALERTLLELEAVVADAREQSAGRRGTVRVASLPSFAASLLPQVISTCRQRNPGVSFAVRDAVASRVMQLVRDDEVDLGITSGEVPDDLQTLHQVRDRLVLVFPTSHPIGRRKRVTLEHVADLPLVLTDAGTSVRALVDSAFQALGRRPQLVCEATYMMTAVAMVRAGLGVTILPASAREVALEQELSSRPIAGSAMVRTMCVVKRRRRTLSPACEAFLSECVAATKRS